MALEPLDRTVPLDALICTLSHNGEIKAQTHKCFDRLIRASVKAGLNLGMDRQSGALIPLSRNRGAEKSVDSGAKFLLFIDSDMVFEEDALMRLMKHDKDIISGIAVSRAAPFTPVAKMRKPDGMYDVKAGLNEGRLFEVDGVGAAFLLVKTSVFKALPQPYFAIPAINQRQDYEQLLGEVKSLRTSYSDAPEMMRNKLDSIIKGHAKKPKNRSLVGEDYYFCELARDHGFKVYVDTAVHIGHLGEIAFTLEHYLDYKDQTDAKKREEDLEATNAA